MVRLPAPPGAARRGALRAGAMKPSIVRGPAAFDRFLTGLTRSKAAVGTMGRLWRNCVSGGAVQLRRVAPAASGRHNARGDGPPLRLAFVLRPVRFPSLSLAATGGVALAGHSPAAKPSRGNADTGRSFSGGSNGAVAPS